MSTAKLNMFEEEVVTEEKLDNLGKLVKEYQDAESVVNTIAEELKKAQETFRAISQDIIPKVILGTGFSELKLSSGEKVIIKAELKAEIPKTKLVSAFDQMIKATQEVNEGCSLELATALIEDLFKSQLVIDNPTKELETSLIKQGILFDKPKSIHWATLKKWCQGIKSQGGKIPEDINVFEYNQTIIK